VGQVDHRLGEFFVHSKGQLVEQNGQDNGHGKTEKEVQQIQYQGVTQDYIKIPVGKSLDKPLENTDIPGIRRGLRPRRGPDSPEDVIILKGDDNIGHGDIAENKEKPQGKYKHKIDHPGTLKIMIFIFKFGNRYFAFAHQILPEIDLQPPLKAKLFFYNIFTTIYDKPPFFHITMDKRIIYWYKR
jgi:hypothetical protein